MKLDVAGEEKIAADAPRLWTALIDPNVLARCIPGCSAMVEESTDHYDAKLDLKVASVGGTFEGLITLSDKEEQKSCSIKVEGSGTIGNGTGEAKFSLEPQPDETTLLRYEGVGEISGLVASVGQRILKGVAKHLIGKFFTALKKELAPEPAESK